MNKVVLDANIYVKLFKQETDSQQAIALVSKLVKENVTIFEPSVVVTETITTCEVFHQNITDVCVLFCTLMEYNIHIVELGEELIRETLEITKQGHPKSGYPTFADSLYHALAIREMALFITADKRHYVKAKRFGNIALLNSLYLA